eukprot:CAMPEP_0181417382 /NCGR_PEP_ID=MMETSP1110-20121109/11012_1 /TAXON_ID=174948 /ORGANISM="Symbiodinium sp., Strain CCMP421" /LENGTH=164 /DNA_ID=CAMNT_0023540331 /DNA_START=460 /DNA_END=954 /DNA_ORIENTATION=-
MKMHCHTHSKKSSKEMLPSRRPSRALDMVAARLGGSCSATGRSQRLRTATSNSCMLSRPSRFVSMARNSSAHCRTSCGGIPCFFEREMIIPKPKLWRRSDNRLFGRAEDSVITSGAVLLSAALSLVPLAQVLMASSGTSLMLSSLPPVVFALGANTLGGRTLDL